jgi:hypothetical protein
MVHTHTRRGPDEYLLATHPPSTIQQQNKKKIRRKRRRKKNPIRENRSSFLRLMYYSLLLVVEWVGGMKFECVRELPTTTHSTALQCANPSGK